MGWSFSFKQHGHISLGVWAMAAVRSITCTLSLISFTAVSPCSSLHVFALPSVSLAHTHTHTHTHAHTHTHTHTHTHGTGHCGPAAGLRGLTLSARGHLNMANPPE